MAGWNSRNTPSRSASASNRTAEASPNAIPVGPRACSTVPYPGNWPAVQLGASGVEPVRRLGHSKAVRGSLSSNPVEEVDGLAAGG